MAPGDGLVAVALAGLVCGMGFGLFQAPNNRTMIATAPTVRSGAAAGMLGLSRLCGQMTGVVIAGLLFCYVPVTSSRFSLIAAGIASLGTMLTVGWPAGRFNPSANRFSC